MKATPNIDPKTIPKSLTGKAPLSSAAAVADVKGVSVALAAAVEDGVDDGEVPNPC